MLQNSLHSTAEYIKLYRRISKMLPRNSWESDLLCSCGRFAYFSENYKRSDILADFN